MRERNLQGVNNNCMDKLLVFKQPPVIFYIIRFLGHPDSVVVLYGIIKINGKLILLQKGIEFMHRKKSLHELSKSRITITKSNFKTVWVCP